MAIFATIIFVLGYLAIASENRLKTSKSAIALLLGGVLWLLVGFSAKGNLEEALIKTGADVFAIVIFLLCAMSLVEILVHYKFFDIIRGKLFSLGLDNRKQFIVISTVTFFLSAVLDNLTTTIVMIQIARRFFKKENLVVTVAAIVIAANAGGAFSPIGDVTTIMLWLAGKFGSLEIIQKGFLPAFVLFFVSIAFLFPKIKNGEFDDNRREIISKLLTSEKIVLALSLGSFSLPFFMNTVFHLPPYFGLLIGLGLVWVVVDIFKQIRPNSTHLEASIENLIKKTDLASLKFFIGILLAVSALKELGILDSLSHLLLGEKAEIGRLITGSVGIGLVSAILDNVPLAALSLQLVKTELSSIWILLAITLGTGGSLLIIGSAAGVVAMGMVKELNFGKYFKIAFVPALAGYFAGIGTWLFQYYFLRW